MPVKKEKDYEDNHRISRSTKLRKYASVYKSYVRKTEQSKISKSPRIPRRPRKTEKPSKKKEESFPKEVRIDYTEKPSKKKDESLPKDVRIDYTEKQSKVPKSRKITLNSYQKFVQQESKKDKYKDMPGKQRLSAIALEWKKISE